MQKNWIPIQLPTIWPSTNIFLVEVEGKKICISKVENRFYAYTDVCPHAGVSLSDGGWLVKECIIVCPLHNYKFNIKTGRNTSEEGYKLRIYPIREIDNQTIEINILL
ncbi:MULTISPECIES: Rieske (2Fe-2S) protein [Chitinophagaceae]